MKKNKKGFEFGESSIKFDHPVIIKKEERANENANLAEHIDEGGGVTIDGN